MPVLSFEKVADLKKRTELLGYKLHMHDTCGGQSFSLEPITDYPSDIVFDVIEDFFMTNGMKVDYYGSTILDFVAK